VVRGWRKLHNEELHNLCAAPNMIRVIKSRMRWAGHLARMGVINAYQILLENLKRRDHSEDLGVDVILE
jgi:hypothetical protein